MSAAGAGVAAVFTSGKAEWQRGLFILFLVMAVAAFVILLVSGLQGLTSWLRARGRGRENPEASPAAASAGKAPDGPQIQIIAANGQGNTAIGAQNGSVFMHPADPAQ